MSKILIIIGLILVALGLLWPLITQLGLGHLPGDIRIERKDFVVYFPIVSCIVVSLLISLVIWLINR
jgi:hypothetical protein